MGFNLVGSTQSWNTRNHARPFRPAIVVPESSAVLFYQSKVTFITALVP